MHQAISKLLSLASGPIVHLAGLEHAVEYVGNWGPLGQALATVLQQRNGFYAFESALLVRPLQHTGAPLGLLEWNSHDLWKGKYLEQLEDILFFAEDAFGGQFCIRGGKICTFDPETGLFEVMSPSLEAWAGDLLADRDFRTGYPLAHAWQVQTAPLLPGTRLLPKIPFCCGGKFEVENLYPLEEVKGMLFRASIANQIRDLPDGAEIVFDLLPPKTE